MRLGQRQSALVHAAPGKPWPTQARPADRGRLQGSTGPKIDAKLLHAAPGSTPKVARMLVAMRSLSEAAGDLNGFEEYLAEVGNRLCPA
jgi:hypothetical protein